MESPHDNRFFLTFKEQVQRLNDYLQSFEDDTSYHNKSYSSEVRSMKKLVEGIKSNWNKFEELYEESTPDHNLDFLEEYGALVAGNQARWEVDRKVHEDVQEERDESSESKLEIIVEYNEDVLEDGEYQLSLNDDKYDLEINAKRRDVQSILSLLIDLASKFGFEKEIEMDEAHQSELSISELTDSAPEVLNQNA